MWPTSKVHPTKKSFTYLDLSATYVRNHVSLTDTKVILFNDSVHKLADALAVASTIFHLSLLSSLWSTTTFTALKDQCFDNSPKLPIHSFFVISTISLYFFGVLFPAVSSTVFLPRWTVYEGRHTGIEPSSRHNFSLHITFIGPSLIVTEKVSQHPFPNFILK